MFTRAQWAHDLLATLGNTSPVQEVVNFVVGWSTAETVANAGAKFNLLNTTQPANDATQFNSVGVRNYTSYQEGLQETAITLENGYYPALLTALRVNDVASLSGPSPAVLANLNTWCGQCHYGVGFITLGAEHLNDQFDYGSAPAPAAPPPPAGPTQNQINEALATWNMFFATIDKPAPPTGTGIYISWFQQWLAGKIYGCPLTFEQNQKDWSGKPIIVQQFAGARCEWDGTAHWYGPAGKLN